MVWRVELAEPARKQLDRLDRPVQKRILRFLRERIATEEDPRRLGQVLHGRYAGLWRYRVGSYRIICRIEDDVLVVLVLGVGDRKDVYD